MASISSPSNFHNRVDPQHLPAKENSADPTPIPKPDLAWWRRLLNFFKELFDRLFNRNQESQPNNGNKGNNDNNDGDTVIFTAQTVSGQEPLDWKPAAPNRPPIVRHGRHGGGGSATPQQAVVRPQNHKDDNQKQTHGGASVSNDNTNKKTPSATPPKASPSTPNTDKAALPQPPKQHAPPHGPPHQTQASSHQKKPHAHKTSKAPHVDTKNVRIVSDNTFNQDIAHQVARLAQPQKDRGVQHHIQQLSSIANKQLKTYMPIMAKDPNLGGQTKSRKAVVNAVNDPNVLSPMRMHKQGAEIITDPPHLESFLFDAMTLSKDPKIQNMAKDILTTLDILKESLGLHELTKIYDELHRDYTREYVLSETDIQKLQELLKDKDISKNTDEILALTADACLLTMAEKNTNNTKAHISQALNQARNVFNKKLKSPPKWDFNSSDKFNWVREAETNTIVQDIDKDPNYLDQLKNIYTYFLELLTLDLGSPPDKIDPADLAAILDKLNSSIEDHVFFNKTKWQHTSISESYEKFIQSLFEFAKTFLPKHTGISKADVEKWIASPEISARRKWWAPKELTKERRLD